MKENNLHCDLNIGLQDSMQLLSQVMDCLPFPMFIKDARDEYRYLFCNKRFAKEVEFPKEEIQGCVDGELFDKGLAVDVRQVDEKVMEQNGVVHYEDDRFQNHTGVRDMEKWKVPFRGSNGQEWLIGISNDVTERNHRLKCEQFKTELVSYIVDHHDFMDVCNFMGERLMERMGCACVMLFKIGEDKKERIGFWGTESEDESKEYCSVCPLFMKDEASWGQEQMLAIEDVQGEFKDLEFHGCQVASLLTARVFFKGKLWGRLAMHFRKQRRNLTAIDKQVVHVAVDTITMALEREALDISLEQKIVENRKLIENLQRERDTALAATKAKEFFFATVSHDIRTPLNAIVGFAQLLHMGVADQEEQKKYLEAILFSSDTLLRLINDVLDLSKLEADKMVIVPEYCDFSRLAQNTLMAFEQGMKTKGVVLEERIEPMPMVKIDEQRVRQILFNLLGNAVKFTKAGSITLSASYEVLGADDGVLCFSVKDTGIGIASEDIGKLTQPFMQISSDSQMHGTGLGLSICSRLLEKMGGKLEIESELGKGSTFIVKLHHVEYVVAKPDAPGAAAGEGTKAIAPKAVGMPSVLLVDDSPVNLSVLKAMCSCLGLADIAMASDGEKALEVLNEHKVDVVLTDMWMPNMDGKALVAAIKRSERFANTAVYAVTADVETRKIYKELGFDGVLLKPLTLERLLELFS